MFSGLIPNAAVRVGGTPYSERVGSALDSLEGGRA
jgi:hypothetical protein